MSAAELCQSEAIDGMHATALRRLFRGALLHLSTAMPQVVTSSWASVDASGYEKSRCRGTASHCALMPLKTDLTYLAEPHMEICLRLIDALCQCDGMRSPGPSHSLVARTLSHVVCCLCLYPVWLHSCRMQKIRCYSCFAM